MPKIDYVVANPPYGEKNLFKGSLDLHFRIVETVLDHCNDKMVVIMPNRICFTNSNNMDKWKEKFTKLSEITNEGNPFDNVDGLLNQILKQWMNTFPNFMTLKNCH